MNHKEFGNYGENLAKKYLLNKGFVILESNWTFKQKEIDLIAEKNGVVHIIEVKTRKSDTYENPHDAVTLKKQRFLVAAANYYLDKRTDDPEICFDIISIIANNNQQKIEFIEDAFYPLLR